MQSRKTLDDSLPRFVSPAACADNLFKAAVNCLSNPVIQIPHFLDSFTAGRSRTLYGGWAIVRRPGVMQRMATTFTAFSPASWPDRRTVS